jgi:two-component system nitrate/nitrite response regulator NarL
MNAPVRSSIVKQPATPEPTREIEVLLKLILSKIDNSTSSTPRSLDGGMREIILDTEIEGVRCLFVRTAQKAKKLLVMLSPREQAIARMVAEGYANKTIAAILDISAWTVGTHLRRVFAKLGVGSRAAMVAHLIERGVLIEHIDNKPR